MIIPRRKTLAYFALSLALVAVVVFGLNTTEVQAAGIADSFKNFASKLGGIAGDTAMAAALVWLVLLFIFEFATYIVALAGLFLDTMFGFNLIATPGSDAVVLAGWTILRDVANGLFILLVLWVAITIIFNLETLGGKRLLVRIIVVALLINFSLLMTTTIFAFANQLALPFARALNLDPFDTKTKTTLSTMIMRETKMQTVANIIREKGATEEFVASIKKAQESANPQAPPQTPEGPASLWLASIPQSLGVVPAAQADVSTGVGVAGTCLLSPASKHWIGWLACGAIGVIVGAFASATDVVTITATVAGWALGPYVNLAVADLFLVVTAAAFFSAAILLAVRYIAMMFLGVFAPIAFLGLVIPRYGERIWNMWLDNLFRWAFVAPIFYFLFYLSLLMLQATNAAQSQIGGSSKINFQGNALSIFSWALFLVFLWASIFLTRKAAGMGAEAALTFGKKLAGVGLGLGTGLIARKALPWLGEKATAGLTRINALPAFGRAALGGLPAKALQRVTKASRQQVVDAEARINRMGMTSAEIQQALASRQFRNAADVAGAVRVLQKNRDLTPQPGVTGYGDTHLRQAADTMRNLNLDFVPFLRANPTIATREDFATSDHAAALNRVLADNGRTGQTPTPEEMQEATRRLAWQKVRPGDIETMDLGIFSNVADPQGTAKRMFWHIAGGDHLSRMGRLNTDVTAQLQAYLDTHQDVWDSFDQEKKQALTQYFAANAAKEFGWHLPPYVTPTTP